MTLTPNTNKQIGELLKFIREKALATQADVADRLDLKTNQYISNVERGVCVVSERAVAAYISLIPLKSVKKIMLSRIADLVADDLRAQIERIK